MSNGWEGSTPSPVWGRRWRTAHGGGSWCDFLDGPAYPAELADLLGTGRANVSNHLACLRGCGLVITEHEGRFVRYQVAHPDLAEALRLLAGVPLATEPGHADLDGRR